MLTGARHVRRAVPLLLLGLACGCSPGDGAGGEMPEPDIEVVARPPAPGAEPEMPLQDFDFDQEGLDVLRAAEQKEARACMEAEGFEYHPLPAEPTEPLVDVEQRPGSFEQYGITSDADAQRYGYRGMAIAAAAVRDPNQPSLTEQYGIDYVVALIGERVVEPDKEDAAPGCAEQAATEVARSGAGTGSDGRTSELVGRLWLEAAERTADDSRVVGAVDDWSRCMRRRGHAFDEPQAPVTQFLEGVDVNGGPDVIAAPAAAEIATARDDVACKVEVDLEAVWLAVETAYQEALIERDAEALEEYVAWRDGHVEHARGILSRP